MRFKVDSVGAERMSSGRLFQATGPATQNAQLPSPGYEQIATGSGMKNTKVRNSRNWDAQFV